MSNRWFRSVVVAAGAMLSSPGFADGLDPLGHAPAGMMFDHVHRQGEWMVGLRFEEGRFSDYLIGSRRADDATIVAAGYTMRAESMTMKMAMLDLMWAPSDRLTLMVMPQFMQMSMRMVGVMGADEHGGGGHGGGDHDHDHDSMGHGGTHRVSGLGDTILAAIWKLNQDPTRQWLATFAISAPTGDVDRRDDEGHFVHYAMQPGSGTWDVMPTVTYTRTDERWQWGLQGQIVRRISGFNDSGYRLGNGWQVSGFGAWRANEWLSLSARLAVSDQDAISGHYNGPHHHSAPEDLQHNYGGQVIEAGLGANAVLGGMRVGLEWRTPLDSDLNGIQLERDSTVTLNISHAF